MTTTIPAHDLSLEKRQEHRNLVQELLKRRAIDLGIAPHALDDLTIRDLSPEDLGLTSWATPAQDAGTTVNWIDCITKDRKILAIYKVLQLSAKPKVSALAIYKGVSKVGYHELELCYAGLPIIENLKAALMNPTTRAVLDRMAGREEFPVSPDIGSHMEAYFGEPYVIDPDYSFKIEVKARFRTSGDYLVLGGYVAERRGETIL